jgi:HK97 family phage portal protein
LFDTFKSIISGLSIKAGIPISSPGAFDIFAPVSASGVAIGPESAMRVPAVCQGVSLISESLSILEVGLFREGPNGREQIKDPPALAVIKSPNGWTSRADFIGQITLDSILSGDGIAVAVRVRDKVRELHRVDPRATAIEIDLQTGEPVYRATLLDGSSAVYSWKDVVHVRQRSVNGLRGLGLLHTAREAIELAILLEQHAAKLFAAGARPGGILSTPGRIDQQTLDRLRNSFESRYSGVSGGGKTMILESGLTFTPVTFASTDAQFQEARAFQVVEISRALNLPATLLNDMSASTFNNVESQAQAFLDRCLMPQVERVERALERVLLTDQERADGYEIEFCTDALVRANLQARYAAWATAIQNGIMTSNEIREREGLPPVDGGDQILRTIQAQPVDQPAQPAPKNGGAA